MPKFTEDDPIMQMERALKRMDPAEASQPVHEEGKERKPRPIKKQHVQFDVEELITILGCIMAADIARDHLPDSYLFLVPFIPQTLILIGLWFEGYKEQEIITVIVLMTAIGYVLALYDVRYALWLGALIGMYVSKKFA